MEEYDDRDGYRVRARYVVSSPDDFRSGAPLTKGRNGIFNAALLIYEEQQHQICRVRRDGGAKTEDTITLKGERGVPRKFLVAAPLSYERLPLEWHVRLRHRLKDVKIGDKAGLALVQRRNGPVALLLAFTPSGGKIPPAEDEHLGDEMRTHNRRNAQQFVEEIFVPKLLPDLMGRFLR